MYPKDKFRYSAYKVPVKSLFDDVKHIRVESFKDDISNNLIECFNKQFKAWYKTKQGFPSFRSANNLISMFVFFFNFVRPHSALDGLTPARVAGLSLSKNKNRGICLWYNTFLTFRPYLHNIGFECFVKAGADHITISIEATKHVHRVIQQIKSLGVTVGVALNPATSLDVLTYILQELDMVLLMTVNPGFGGQKFIPEVLPKIVALSEILKEVNPLCRIEVDGGINSDTARLASRAGAEILVAGSAVFAAPDPEKAIHDILQAAREEQQ